MHLPHPRLFAAALLAPLFSPFAACGSAERGASSGVATAADPIGTLNGSSFAIKQAIFAPVAGDYNTLIVVLSDRADTCSKFAAGQLMRSWSALVFDVYEVTQDQQNPVTGPGTYTLAADGNDLPSYGMFGRGLFAANDANCNDAAPDSVQPVATSGTLTLNAITASTATGSFAATFMGTPLKANFSATLCEALVAPQEAARTCEPASN